MKVTGERLIPGLMSKDGEIEHFHRYSAVAEYMRNKIVLDAACGTGYGSGILSQYASKVFGIDISEDAVKYANENYSQNNTTFIQANISELPFKDETFDVVVSFETIEHVITEMQDEFLKEIKRVLKPTGVLIMSTPNKKLFTDERGLLTKFHFREFYKREFLDFLGRDFKNIKIYHQFFSKVSNLVSYDENMEGDRRYKFDAQKEGLFLIAVASNSEAYKDFNLNSTYYYPDEYAKLNDQIQVYYGKNNCFKEEESAFVPISNNPGVISESIDIDNGEIKYIRLDPFSQPGKMRIVEVIAITNENKYISLINYSSNAENVDNDIMTFYTSDPQIIFELDSPTIIKNIVVQFEIYPAEFNLYDEFSKLRESLARTCAEEKNDIIEQKNDVIKQYKGLEIQYRNLEVQFLNGVEELKQQADNIKRSDRKIEVLELQYKEIENKYKELERQRNDAILEREKIEEQHNILIERYNAIINSKAWLVFNRFFKK